MAIEYILESYYKPAPEWSDIAKIKLKVHCSCGKSYKIKEKFYEKYLGDREYIRSTKCPSCKDISYIEYTITSKQDSSKCNLKIVTNEILEKKD